MTDVYNHLFPVVVLYNLLLDDSSTLQCLDREAHGRAGKMLVFVYDNSPMRNYAADRFIWKSLDIIYRHDPNNSGLGKAYNTGADEAPKHGKDWLILFDQDTLFEQGFLQLYNKAFIGHHKISLFAPILKLKDGSIFSPFIPKHKRGYPATDIQTGIHSLHNYFPVNSGIMISVNLFKKAGGYNEKVKVDFSDMQFLERVLRINNDFCVTDVVGVQDFSAFEVSIEKQERRFSIYLDDAVACDKETLSDKIGFFYAVTRHMLALVLKRRRFSFFVLYIRRYLIR